MRDRNFGMVRSLFHCVSAVSHFIKAPSGHVIPAEAGTHRQYRRLGYEPTRAAAGVTVIKKRFRILETEG
jgi:hypothetical protein